jgi:hypothetical protein
MCTYCDMISCLYLLFPHANLQFDTPYTVPWGVRDIYDQTLELGDVPMLFVRRSIDQQLDLLTQQDWQNILEDSSIGGIIKHTEVYLRYLPNNGLSQLPLQMSC